MTDLTILLERYNKLSSFEKTLLKILSIVYEPAQTTLIVNCLRKLDIRNPRGNRPTSANLSHYFSKFQELELLTDDRQCHENIVEILSRKSAAEGTFAEYAEIIQKDAPVSYYYGKWTIRCWRAMREMRIGIYTQQFDLILDAVDFLTNQCRETLSAVPAPVRIVTSPFDPLWLQSLPPSFQFFLLNSVFRYAQTTLLNFPDIIGYITDDTIFSKLDSDEKLPFQRLLLNQYILMGDLDKAEALLQGYESAFIGTGAAGAISFLKGENNALDKFQLDLEALQTLHNSKKVTFIGHTGLFYLLALLDKYDTDAHDMVADRIALSATLFADSVEEEAYQFMAVLVNAQWADKATSEEIVLSQDKEPAALSILFAGLCQYWLNSTLQPELEIQLTDCFERSIENGYHLFSLIFAEILALTSSDNTEYLPVIEKLQKQTGIISLPSLLQPEEPWKRSLQALINATRSQPDSSDSHSIRLVWLVDFKSGEMTIFPKEQKRNANGTWSKGRPVSLSRLYSGKNLTFLTVQDRKVVTAIQKIQNRETHGVSYSFDMDKALTAMVSHPLLFLTESPGTPVDFIIGEPELLVEESGQELLHIHFAQEITDADITVYQETPTRFKIISINDNHRRIARITGKQGLTVPKNASNEVLTAIGNISSFMTVHSAIASTVANGQRPDITFVEADPSIYMHMLPYGQGFRLEMFVKPFNKGGHYLKPGQGVENLMAEVQGKRLQTKRNLALEEDLAREIEESCPILDLAVDLEQDNDREWHLQDPADCLQALMELQAIEDQVIIEWPEGEKLAIIHQSNLKNLNLKIRTNRQNWFALSGHIQIDQDRIINLKDLLEKVRKSSNRFIQIAEGQFLALTQEFKKRLEEINTYAEDFPSDDSDEIIVHPLAAMPLEDLAEQAETSTDKGWKSQLKRIHESQSFTPVLPSTLQADLRDYQIEGYQWLARLAHWGVGGCLADDMGLGKTLQSLAIVLQMATEGPSLVIAPTSVSSNWETEANRFTPTLNIKDLSGKNRKEIIENLGPFDLLITTYTLLQQESELLSSVVWQAVILDEAQSIKNAATKRSKAAMALRANFKLLTTGTPIENHLGELWNLFHFINPGLLGSLQRFNERFAIPIERYHDNDARRKLKKLIRPFLLRRIKSEVLEELPERTEVTLQVEQNEDEIHFYEALRQKALDTLEQNREKKGQHLQILTEIMRLRQACCNPRLIDSETSIESSKAKVFARVIEELLGGRHKALVFSQFIGHLRFLREYLDEKGISYQYLDGSTSRANRKQRVMDFQAGKGDLFLISLKAGGLGLNLTAADYVIHMDPWWNPAIEDQASDRAHRIGQTRPVTIYRLVCKNTIEEKIVKLHQEKRDLAGSLLQGTDMSAKMSSDELLDLIKGTD